MFSGLQVLKRLFNTKNDPIYINGSVKLDTHAYGQLSYADTCLPETHRRRGCGGSTTEACMSTSATFVGTYDGHGCNRVSGLMSRNFFNQFIENWQRRGCISPDLLKETMTGIEAAAYNENTTMIPHGYYSSYSVVFLWEGIIHVLNRGHSNVVLGSSEELGGRGSSLNGPFTCSKKLEEKDKFMIIATSGFWKYVSSGQAIECVEANLNKRSGIATKLCRLAHDKTPYDDMPSANTHVLVLYFDKTDVETQRNLPIPNVTQFRISKWTYQ